MGDKYGTDTLRTACRVSVALFWSRYISAVKTRLRCRCANTAAQFKSEYAQANKYFSYGVCDCMVFIPDHRNRPETTRHYQQMNLS